MATYYVRTDGSDSASGANDTNNPTTGAWLTISKAASTVAAGDTVYIRASAGNASSYPTSSLDYNPGAFYTPANGSAASGFVRWIGYNGMPTIGSAGLVIYNCQWQWFENLYFVTTTADYGTFGILGAIDHVVIKDCVFNLNNQAAFCGMSVLDAIIRNTEVYGGTTSPTASSGSYGIDVGGTTIDMDGVTIRHCRDHGVRFNSGGGWVRNSLIYKNVGDGIHQSAINVAPVVIANNTIDGNSGHGVRIAVANGAAWAVLRNNILSNHTQASKYGISVATSSSDIRTRDWGYNCLYNNTSNYENVTAASTDITSNPTYADAANGDYTPTNSALKVGYPTTHGGPFGSITNETWIGAIQPEEPAGGGGGMIVHPGMGGGFRG